jgi:hypothetical protein
LAILPGLQNKVTRLITPLSIPTKPGVDIIFYCVQTYYANVIVCISIISKKRSLAILSELKTDIACHFGIYRSGGRYQ